MVNHKSFSARVLAYLSARGEVATHEMYQIWKEQMSVEKTR